MNTTRSPLAAAAVAAALALCGASAPNASGQAQTSGVNQNRPARFEQSFDVLTKKSIFSRDRRAATSQAQAGSGSPGRVLSPEQSLAFRGVMVPDGEYVAFLENVVSQQITVVRPGDRLALGQAGLITLDTLQYIDPEGKVRDIRLGQDLTGQVASSGGGGYSTSSPAGASASGGTSGSGATTPPGGSGSAPSGDTASIIERMKRAREAGK